MPNILRNSGRISVLVFGGWGVGTVSIYWQLMLCIVSVCSQSAIFCVHFVLLHGFLTGRDKYSHLFSRVTKRGLGPHSKGGPAKNLNTKSERLTLICRVAWVWV